MKVTQDIPPDAVNYVLRNLRRYIPEMSQSEAREVVRNIWLGDTKTLTELYNVSAMHAELIAPVVKTWNGNYPI